jgi:hypothetical protein
MIGLWKTNHDRPEADQDIAKAGLPMDSAGRLLTPEEFEFLRNGRPTRAPD